MTLKRNKEFFDKFLHDCEDHETIDVVDTYPWKESYFIRNHHFMESEPVRNEPAKVNQIFIAKINRD
jgi:hypothetical protein